MAISLRYGFLFVIVIFLLLQEFNYQSNFLVNGEKYSQRRRKSKEIEDRINKLDEGTKKRIHAMKASGMPKAAIAEKIAYEAGGKNVASRIVEAMHDMPSTPKKKKKTNVGATDPQKTKRATVKTNRGK